MNSKGLLIKSGLILLGISMPLLVTLENTGVSEQLQNLRENPSGDTLMITALLLVFLNTIRALPHYIGAFLLGDEIGTRLNKPWLSIIVPILVIPTVYFIINLFNPLKYNFGGPAILLLFFIILLHVLGKGRLRPVTKSIVLTQLLFGVQWLDTVVGLSPYGFGNGPVSSEVKAIATEIGFNQVLSIYSLLLCSIFLINALVLAVYLAVSQQKWEMKQNLSHIQIEVLQSRAGREVLHLVHDLKTPLAVIEGLNSLIELKTNDEKVHEYTGEISRSINSSSTMISEILYEDKKNWCTLNNLISYIRAHRLTDHSTTFKFQLEADDNIKIYINKIRLTRAVVNLIDNANDAVSDKVGAWVKIQTRYTDGKIWIGVSDNGNGITPKELSRIWNAGYSTKSHPGIGLTFIQNVVQSHNAELKVDSKIGFGTTFWIIFPERSVKL